MKPKSIVAFVLVLSITASCRSSRSGDGPVIVTNKPATSTSRVSTTSPGRLPPGQAKKLNGDNSAKKYAPGQQKKRRKGSSQLK